MPDGKATRAVVKLQYMAAEPGAANDGHASLLEGWECPVDEPMLDGPVSRRLAVVDFDPDSGAVQAGAPFLPPDRGRRLGRYRIADESDSDSAHFRQVSVFGAVMKMIDMFEEADVLGRKLQWAFSGEQLLVVPQAGIMQNAFYHRGSRSLQFFSFDDPKTPGAMVHTCLSPDIVAHEATHAILDGIAPDLYDATSPQALAIHEAVADIGAVMFALRSRRLGAQVMKMTGGDLKQSNAFNKIAQQFGEAVYGPGRPLRDLTNDRTMATAPNEPHELSEVLTGALYAVLVQLHDDAVDKRMATIQTSRFSASGFALNSAANRLKRLAFRGLDYLPPGEVSFADYGRAIVAADTSSNPHDHHLRDRAKDAFVARGIVASGAELDSVLPPGFMLPADLDLDLLLRSDWAAYQFCERFRAELMIPPGVSFELRPRLDVTKLTYQGDEVVAHTHELILKVGWRETKVTSLIPGLVEEVSVMYGTTLAINWDEQRICGLVSTSPRDASQKTAAARTHDDMRLAFLKQGLQSGLFVIGSPNVQLQGQTLRLKATGKMLHMMMEV
jgi:hypothetical protein